MIGERATELEYAEIKVGRMNALFTESRVDRKSVPLPLIKYEVRYGDERGYEQTVIREAVEENFLGTILAPWELGMDIHDEYALDDDDIDFYPDSTIDLFSFAKEQGIDLKARSGEHLRTIGYIEFKDEFVADEKYGYHLSDDGMHLMCDGEDEAYVKTVESDLFVYYHRDDEMVMFRKDVEGNIDSLASNNYFATEGITGTLENVWERKGEEALIFLDEPARKYLPECARDYEWEIKRLDACSTEFKRIEVYGIRALYVDKSIEPASVPRSLHFYEVGNECDHEQGFSKIAKSVHINFSGTLIAERPLDLGDTGAIHFAPGELELDSDKAQSLKSFAREVGVRMKPEKEQVR